MALTLGYDPETGQAFQVQPRDRDAGMYILGVQGVGKSGFLEFLINQDAESNHATVVLDPHGDLVDNCVAALPANVLIRTSILDMEDEAWPFSLNVFAEAGKLHTETERTAARERIYHIFAVLWPEVTNQVYLPNLLKAAISVFLDNPGCSLLDMKRFFLKA